VANWVVVYQRVDYPLRWCCVVGSLGVMSTNGLSYTSWKDGREDALRLAAMAPLVSWQMGVSRIPSLRSSQFPALPFQLFKRDGRE
jgi:hypothetical protein